MIRLKVFISSVQKELREERTAIGRLLVMDDFLRGCTAPRIFEDYPQPLRPNPKAYLGLLRQCQIYLLVIGKEYGGDAGDGLSATHEEYRLAQQLGLPTLVCVKGEDGARSAKAATFFDEVRKDKHTYSRFSSTDKLLDHVAERLREHIKESYDIVPRKNQVEQTRLTTRAASDYERGEIPSLSWDDLDASLALDMMAAAEDQDKERIAPSEVPRLLLSRGFLWKDPAADVLRPTVAGALLLARHPSVALVQSRLQLDAYAGTDRQDEPIDSVFLDVPLFAAVEQAVAFIRRNTARPLSVEGTKRRKIESYPAEALREVIANAVAHRDYSDPGAKVSVEVFSDRLRVSSPGLPPGGQTVAKVASGEARSRSRNPLVVQGLSWLEIMDERGSGIRRMTRALEQNGNPPPSFESEDDCLVVGFALPFVPPPAGLASVVSPLDSRDLPPRDAILAEVQDGRAISTKVCVQRLGIPRATAKRWLTELVEEGMLEKSGSGPAILYRLKHEPV